MFALTIKSEDHPPPPPSFLSPVLISTSFAHPSTTHSINFAAKSSFKGKTQSGMDSRAGGMIQGGVGSFSQKYQWLYNSITGLAKRVRRERKGNILPGVAPFSPSFLLPNTSTILSEMNKSICLSDSEDVIIKAACKGPHPSRSNCLILLSDLLCDLLWTMGGSFCLDIPAQQLYAPSLPYRELSSI